LVKNGKNYTRNPDFIYRKVIDEFILIPVHQDVADMDSIYILNGVGAFIWENLDPSTTLTDLEATLLEEYDADPNEITNDMERFLRDMTDIGAIQEVQE
jgi:hypothetical protein